MALGGDGLMPQAVSLTWRMTRRKMNVVALDHAARSWEHRVSLLFFPHTVPLASEWEKRKVLEMDTTNEAPLSCSTPQRGLQRQWGHGDLRHRGAWCKQTPRPRCGVECRDTVEQVHARP